VTPTLNMYTLTSPGMQAAATDKLAALLFDER
jgi:hypothetical protein